MPDLTTALPQHEALALLRSVHIDTPYYAARRRTDGAVEIVTRDGALLFASSAAPAAPLPLPGTTPQPGVPAPAIQPPAAYAYITTVDNTRGQGAHLRKKSSQNSETQGMYPNGTQVYVLKYGEYWSRVWVDGKTGWMMTKLLQGTNEP